MLKDKAKLNRPETTDALAHVMVIAVLRNALDALMESLKGITPVPVMRGVQ